MTNPAGSTATVVARRPGQPLGDLPRWRILYDAMAQLNPGDLIRYEDMGDLLGLDFLDAKGKQTILAAVRKAGDELRKREKKVFAVVRGHGYQFAQPGQVIELAHRHQTRAMSEVEAGRVKVDTIDLSQLDVTTARLVEATAMGFARQAGLMRQLDVRQERLEAAMAALTVTAETAATRVEETSTRVQATEAEISHLRERLAHLEAGKPGQPSSTGPLPPVFLS